MGEGREGLLLAWAEQYQREAAEWSASPVPLTRQPGRRKEGEKGEAPVRGQQGGGRRKEGGGERKEGGGRREDRHVTK